MQQKPSKLSKNTTQSRAVWGQLTGDFAAAILSAILVAAPVTIIDRAVVESVATGSKKSLFRRLHVHSSAALSRPGQLIFSRPFGIVWALYATTYAAANGSETLATRFNQAAAGTLTFVSTMLVNVPMGVWKDIRFAQLYGASIPTSAKVPGISPTRAKVSKTVMATFLFRDGLTIFGSFIMAPAMTAAIPDQVTDNAHTKNTIAQLTVPVLSQLVATPVHLLGLDLHNRRHHIPLWGRIRTIRRDLPSATVVRCIRIVPAFGFGCVANWEMRSRFHAFMRSRDRS